MCNIQTPDISTAPPQLNQKQNKRQDITVTSLQGTSSLITDSNVSTESGHFLFQKLLPQKTGACLRLDEQQWSQSSCSRTPDISFKRQNKRNSFLALFSQSQRWLWLPSRGSEILVLSRLKYKHKQGEHAFFPLISWLKTPPANMWHLQNRTLPEDKPSCFMTHV